MCTLNKIKKNEIMLKGMRKKKRHLQLEIIQINEAIPIIPCAQTLIYVYFIYSILYKKAF